jgi:hypothetical protein
MQSTASVIRCHAVRRFGVRSHVFHVSRLFHLSRISRVLLGFATAAVALGGMILPPPAAAQVIVRDLQPVSMQFRAVAQDGIRAHQAQVRTRQVRVRQAKDQAALPRFANNLSMSGDQGNIPLRLRDAPVAPPAVRGPLAGLKVLSPSTVGVINTFIRGDLHTDADSGTASSLSTTDLTIGSDYRVSEDMMFGIAAGRLHTGSATGTTVSAYLTLQPLERIFLDMSLSYGVHQARTEEIMQANGPAHTGADGVSRSFSMTLNHPRQIGEWHWSPYSRYDRILTDVEVKNGSAATAPFSYGLSAISLGSTAATTWTTPLGAVRPMVMVELQKEVITVAGLGTTSSLTQGVVGFGMTTRVSRDVSAFAESRYESDLAATLDRQMMLGVKFAF